MQFVSTVDHKLAFEIDGMKFEVEPKGTCEIPDRKASAVADRGLPMTVAPAPVPEPKPAPVAAEPKSKKPAPADAPAAPSK